jgi:hypothetical protein
MVPAKRLFIPPGQGRDSMVSLEWKSIVFNWLYKDWPHIHDNNHIY